jgi:hypothetical protein
MALKELKIRDNNKQRIKDDIADKECQQRGDSKMAARGRK